MENPIPLEVAEQIASNVFDGRKLEAIKLYRESSGKGLKESKDFIDALEEQLRAKEPGKFNLSPAGKGCLSALVLYGAGAAGLLAAAFV